MSLLFDELIPSGVLAFILVLQHKGNKLLSICRKIKVKTASMR